MPERDRRAVAGSIPSLQNRYDGDECSMQYAKLSKYDMHIFASPSRSCAVEGQIAFICVQIGCVPGASLLPNVTFNHSYKRVHSFHELCKAINHKQGALGTAPPRSRSRTEQPRCSNGLLPLFPRYRLSHGCRCCVIHECAKNEKPAYGMALAVSFFACMHGLLKRVPGATLLNLVAKPFL
jgi:hypothetical protein